MHTAGGEIEIRLGEPGLDELVKFDLVQQNLDYNEPPADDLVPHVKGKLKMCELDDFCIHKSDGGDGHGDGHGGKKSRGCSEEDKKFFEVWENFSIMCPDLSSLDKGGVIHGSMSDLKSS